MPSKRKRGLRRILTILFAGLPLVCLGLVGISALSNLGLPTHSETLDRLSPAEKARLAEATHLRQSLGEAVWPGWAAADIPIIVHNEAYAFLVGYPQPPDGWIKVPDGGSRGGPWEPVPGDTFSGEPYYRQRLADPEINPENFTALVGERWVATLYTKEYAEIAFISGFGEELPGFLKPVFPYRLFWKNLGGDSEIYIAALLHESFHAYQGTVAAGRLEDAERRARLEASYPWDDPDMEAAWERELDLLVEAVRADTDAQVQDLARGFLEGREARRAGNELSASLVDYERQREWLEGLAKYAELASGLQAASAAGYQALPEMAADPDFDGYATWPRFWSGQVSEIGRMTGSKGETRFYYTGFAQAVLLDRLLPEWKTRIFDEGVWLEDLLREAVEQE